MMKSTSERAGQNSGVQTEPKNPSRTTLYLWEVAHMPSQLLAIKTGERGQLTQVNLLLSAFDKPLVGDSKERRN